MLAEHEEPGKMKFLNNRERNGNNVHGVRERTAVQGATLQSSVTKQQSIKEY